MQSREMRASRRVHLRGLPGGIGVRPLTATTICGACYGRAVSESGASAAVRGFCSWPGRFEESRIVIASPDPGGVSIRN